MVLPIVLGWLGYKAYGAVQQTQSKIADLTATLKPLVNPAKTTLTAVSFMSVSAGFASAVGGLCAVVNTYHGILAQNELIKLHTAIAADVKAISKSLESMANNLEAMINHFGQAQQYFSQHVLDYVSMRSREEASNNSKKPCYFFVYHHGTEWHPAFERLLEQKPVHNLCGLFSNLDVMAAYLVAFRNVVGEHATFHILCPSTNLVFIPDPIEFRADVGDIRIEGELNNQTGKPYIYLNMPGAPKDMFTHICNTADLPAPPKPSYWRRKAASTAGAWAVGLPSAIVATPGGMLVGLGLAVAAAPLIPVAAAGTALAGSAVACGAAAGAAAGTISGMWTGEKIEQAWDRSEKQKSG
ncbi:hypothetical protein KCU77_g12175, partial [Aureobasidium melanogenum]